MGLFKDQIEDAVLKLELESFSIGQLQELFSGRFKRLIALYAKFLFGQRSHPSIKPFPECFRLTVREGRHEMTEWSFSSTAELVTGLMLAVVVVALMFI